MKRVIFIIAGIFAAINIMAQDKLSFMGIPIEGSMSSFCNKLTAKGFSLIDENGNLAYFSGYFTGLKVTVGVGKTGENGNVFSVVILLPERNEWKQLVNMCEHYKDLYTRKYGLPTISKEHNPAQLNSNIAFMQELCHGTVVYGSIWDVAGGNIEISIEKLDDFSGCVMIRYCNAENLEAKIQSDLGDI